MVVISGLSTKDKKAALARINTARQIAKEKGWEYPLSTEQLLEIRQDIRWQTAGKETK